MIILRMTRTAVVLLAVLALVAGTQAVAQKPNLATGLQVTNSTSGNALVDALLGPGVHRVGNATLVGQSDGGGAQQGFFDTVGADIIGFPKGIVLTSGYASNIVGPNESTSQTKGWGSGGDPILESISGKGPGSSHDANVLQFDFTVDPGVNNLAFKYVFGSEEYNTFIKSSFNDAFAFVVDGKNAALLPDNSPVTIDNVNKGKTGVPPKNPDFYRNNILSSDTPTFNNDPSLGLNTEIDGLTTVLLAQVQANLDPALTTHTIRLTISDMGDTALDSFVMLQAGSFTQGGGGGPTVPEPGALALFGALGVTGAGFLFRRRR